MSKLVIVESPAKAKTIQKYLGADYAVLPTIGHIRELPKKDAIDPDNGYSMKYVVSPGKEDAVKKIKGEAKKQLKLFLQQTQIEKEKQLPGMLQILLRIQNLNSQRSNVQFFMK